MLSQFWRRPATARSRRSRPNFRRRPDRQWLRQGLEPLETRQLMAADLFAATEAAVEYVVAPNGDDWNAGSLDQPFATIRRALDAAKPGDTISLRNGVYEGGINIDVDNLTIRSLPGEWAVIQSPLTQWGDGHSDSVIRYGFDVEGGRLENLEITGGYWYGVMFWDWWDSDFSEGSTHVGASGITLDGVKVHDTGVDAIKITPGANDITIINSEVFNAGRRSTTSADGIDNNNGDRMVVRNTFVHDVPGIGILTSGGTEDSIIEQNLVRDTGGAGIVAGFYSELEWLEPNNPDHYAAMNPIVRNNIVVDAGHAGIGIYGADNAQIYNNTLVNAADDAQAPIQFGGYEMWISNTAPSYAHVASHSPVVVNNLIVTNPENDTRMVDIREASITGQLTLDYNLYFGTSTRGTLFIDRNLTGEGTPEQTFSQWQTNYGYDLHSLVTDPQLGDDWHLSADSPAIGAAIALAGLTDDFDGNSRLADPPDPEAFDIGADEFNAGAKLATPPAPVGAPSLEIAQRGYHDYESQTIQVKVVRHGSTADTVTVQYATIGGSAVAGEDFTAVAGTLTFAPGETEKFVSVPLLSDNEAEGDEHFLFTLSGPTTDGDYPARLGHQQTASMTIDDSQTPLTTHYATKWVSPDGSDVDGDGSQAHPWKSLQHAADNVIPGDYVMVMPGKYWGMNVTTDGKPDALITFHALPGVEIDEPFPGQQDGINLEGADFITIEGFYVHDMPRAGLRSVNNDGVILRGNTSDRNTMWGILTGWSENILVENNQVSRSQVEHGIYISNSADGAIVRNNVVWGNRDSGIQFNADGYLPGDGVHSDNVIEGNIIYGNGSGGGAAINLDGVQDSLIRNNLLYDNHSTGIVLYVGFAAEPSTNNVVTNNTVVMAEDARWALLMWNGSLGNVIANNILLNRNPNRGSIDVDSSSLPAYSANNILQDKFSLNGYSGSFADWQAFSGGQDVLSLVIPQTSVVTELNNLFVDPSAGDFHLRAGSAAIDVGDPFHTAATDIFGHARPSDAGIDIGAFEAGQFSPTVRFESADWIGYEFIGMAEIAVTRSGDTEQPLAVQVRSIAGITDGTASADDFQGVDGYLVFRPGESRKTFRIFVNDDAAIESREAVQLDLRVVGDPTGLIPTDQVGDPTGLIPTDQVGDPAGVGDPVGVGDPIPWIPTDQATLHLVSDDAWRPGTIEFDSRSISVNEADGVATITVRRTGGSSGEVSVDFATDDWVKPRQATWIKRHTDLLYPTDHDTPATAGKDYTAQAGTLTFADGETEKTITIGLIDDVWFEGGEAFALKLTNATGGADLGSRSSLKVHIDSDDAKQAGEFVWGAASYVVTEGTPSVNVTIQRLGGGNVEAAVHLYDTGAGNGSTTASAWAGSDYAHLPWEVVFAAGEMSKTISIPIVDDGSTERDEVFSIQLYSPSNDATIGALATTQVTIQDNDSAIEFAQSNYVVNESTGVMQIKIRRIGSTAGTATVDLNINSGNATAGQDFIKPPSPTVTFADGEFEKLVDIAIVDDVFAEGDESFYLSLSNATGAKLGTYLWGGGKILASD